MDFSRYQPQDNAFAQMLQQAQPGGEIAQQAQQPRASVSQEEMEAAARQRGYDNYDQMIQYMERRIPPPRRPQGEAQPSQGGNIFEQLWNDPMGTISGAFDWHPARTIDNASKKLEEANRRNR